MDESEIKKFIVTNKILILSLEDVFYEIKSLYYLFLIQLGNIKVFINISDSQILKNIILEACLVHCRCLMDFFEKQKRTNFYKGKDKVENDDVLCSDFCNYKTSTLNIDKVYKDRINKDLVHLSYGRTERRGNLKEWPIIQIIKTILTRSLDFIRHLLNNKLTGEVKIEVWKSLADNIELIIK